MISSLSHIPIFHGYTQNKFHSPNKPAYRSSSWTLESFNLAARGKGITFARTSSVGTESHPQAETMGPHQSALWVTESRCLDWFDQVYPQETLCFLSLTHPFQSWLFYLTKILPLDWCGGLLTKVKKKCLSQLTAGTLQSLTQSILVLIVGVS